ncbi:phage antirepressor [Streptococcus suis]|uniref:phage antirepressor n=1 Tax=Streptococcus suis TaxID=1307 RepID=UPI000418380E|nr:phage antirepressor [Streptococcus suis]HEM3179485.1 phage antirepressor [Streptococcus suis 92-4172]
MQEIYNFHGQEVRTVTIDNEPYFVGKDVAEILAYKEPNKAITRHVDEEDRTKHPIPTNGGIQDSYIINESGLYSLILSSKLPQAKEFKRWVTSEVLPVIRKHGMFVTDELLDNPDFAIATLQKLKEEREERKRLEVVNTQLQLELQEAQKQARYLDLIIESKGALRVTQIAADYGMSANKFNKTLAELGVQHKVNGQWILYKKHMGKGYTDSHTFDYQDKNGHTRANVTTTWTQKGRLFLYELLKDNGILPLIEQDDVA